MQKKPSYKQVPGLTLATLPPPYPDHGHSEGHALFPFEFGSTVFSEHYKPRCYRIVHNRDIVARMPPPIFYRHVGEIRFIDSHGKVHHGMGGNGRTDFRSDTRNGHENSAERRGTSDSGLAPDAIHDHVPLFYAVLLWKRLVAERSDE